MSYITDNHAYNTSNPQFRYTYSTYEGSSNGFEITLHYKFSTDFVKGMQDVGDGAALAGCLMVILAVIAILVDKYHGIWAILFGVVFFIFTYRDKNKPSPGLTIEYSWHIGGYEAGIIAIAYGLIRFFRVS